MATLTTNHTVSTAQAKYVHAGQNSVSAIYSLSPSISSGDVIQMVKVPAGAVVTDITLTSLVGSIQQIGYSVGDGVSTARYVATSTLSGSIVVRANAGVPYSYSVDDTIDILITSITSATIAGSVAITVSYKVDDVLA